MKSNYHVPADPFRRLILEAIETTEGNEGMNDSLGALTRVALLIFADEIGADEELNRERLRGLLRNGSETFAFDLADRIVTRINVGRWHSDPELNEIYRNVNLRDLDVSFPTDTDHVDDLLEAVKDLGIKGAAELFGINRDTVKRAIVNAEKRVAEAA